jgi:tetratricopeptide (TPR) repeat protein
LFSRSVGLALALPALLAAQPAQPARPARPAAALDAAVAAAEAQLGAGEVQAAESHYRGALLEGWLLRGALDAADNRLPEAREAFQRAFGSAVETRRALTSLALVEWKLGSTAEAVKLLTRVVGQGAKDLTARRLLAQALVANGEPAEAVQELEEAHAAAPDDLELAFTLATGYLRVNRVDAAERTFALLLQARPIPQTRVLIGRTYRDFADYPRARTMLEAALKQDPRVRRAHHYLGTIIAMAEGPVALEEAVAQFREELKLDAEDPTTHLFLGMALAEGRRHAEALPHLEIAVRKGVPTTDAFHYLGRCLIALERPEEAAAALRRALELAQGPDPNEAQLASIHYQLATALRRSGGEATALEHFAAAQRYTSQGTDVSRERLANYLAGIAEREKKASIAPLFQEAFPLSQLPREQRDQLKPLVEAALARTYLNLGILQARAERFGPAAELLEQAAALDPAFPQVQPSLGITYFNAQQFEKAVGPLSRAVEGTPGDASLRRMLALASLNTDAYDKAAVLLAGDPDREGNPSLQYAYGLALVRSHKAAEGERIFARLLAQHGDSAELNVVLGQAHAEQGDFEGAIRSLQRALELKPEVPEANAALGVIYLKQGKLAEAEAALKAELRGRPADLKSLQNLAAVLELESRPEEALPLLRTALKTKPDLADARYLLGKILLAQGAAPEAAEHLEAAVRLAAEDANIHYQLAQAYQRLGRADAAQREFEAFRQLKDKRRSPTP